MKTPVTLTGYVVVALLEAGMNSQVCLQPYIFKVDMFFISVVLHIGRC